MEQRFNICALRDEGFTEKGIAVRPGMSPKGVPYTLARSRETQCEKKDISLFTNSCHTVWKLSCWSAVCIPAR